MTEGLEVGLLSDELVADLTEIGEAASIREAADRLAELLASALGATPVVVYLCANDEGRQLVRTAVQGTAEGAPTFSAELDVLDYARTRGLEVMRLSLRREQLGLVLLGGVPRTPALRTALAVLSGIGTLALSLARTRERSSRAAMKDPSSSSYTFAYFVDVAGREIAMARRHGRRFALATITVEPRPGAAPFGREPTLEVAERVIGAVRDTDVLARVDASEFYLLLPETGGIGALACRRRVLRALSAGAAGRALDSDMGLATFPHDGTDLSRLLRVAKHRAEASARSVVETYGLRDLSLTALVDALLGPLSLRPGQAGDELDVPRYIELPVMDAVGVALAAVREAVRGGNARVVATQHPGLSVGSAVRAEIVRDMAGVSLEIVDVGTLTGGENLDVLAVVAEHATYALVGRCQAGLVRAVHAADPALVDLLVERLGEGEGRSFAP